MEANHDPARFRDTPSHRLGPLCRLSPRTPFATRSTGPDGVFGDGLPVDATNGRRVAVAVHEIAGGSALAEMTTTLRDVAADEIDANAVLDLLEHVSLGRTLEQVHAAIARHRTRRLVAFGS